MAEQEFFLSRFICRFGFSPILTLNTHRATRNAIKTRYVIIPLFQHSNIPIGVKPLS
jgi:hypothetical protein